MTTDTTAEAIKRMQDAYQEATNQYEQRLSEAVDQFQALLNESVQKMANMVGETKKEEPKKPECQWVEIDGESHMIMNEAGAQLIYNTLAAMSGVIQELQQRTR